MRAKGNVDGYVVQRYENGIAVFGRIGTGEAAALLSHWRNCGFTELDEEIAHHIGAALAVCLPEKLQAWRWECELFPPTLAWDTPDEAAALAKENPNG